MKQPITTLTDIASELLGITTLSTRRFDRLDFHDVAVWQVKAALAAAFNAGRRAARDRIGPVEGVPTPFDRYEIQPCRRYRDLNDPGCSFVEPCLRIGTQSLHAR